MKNFLKSLILLSAILIYFFVAKSLILLDPPVWPDESYIADVANNILKESRFGTDLWGNTSIGVKNHLYWYPPIFLNTLSLWFKLLGLSIINLRIFSIFLGIVFLIIFFIFLKKSFLSLGLIFLIIFDHTFLKGSRIGRPEMMTVVLGLFSLYLYDYLKKLDKKTISYVILGFLLSLTALVHLLGVFFLIIVLLSVYFEKHTEKINKLFFLIIGFSIPMLLWLISIFPNYQIFFAQMRIQQSFRGLVQPHIAAIFQYYPIEERIIFLLYFLLSILVSLIFIWDKTKKILVPVLGLFFGWAICWFGKLEWYSIYIVMFVYLSAGMIFSDFSINHINTQRIKFAYQLLFLILLLISFIVNIRIFAQAYSFSGNKNNIYYQFGQDVKKIVPPGKTVYLSTTPDLYFNLYGRNKLYEFAAMEMKRDEYLKLLDDSDYLIINFHLERLFVGNLLDKYIESNRLEEYSIGQDSLYQAKIIKLVPPNLRKLPTL